MQFTWARFFVFLFYCAPFIGSTTTDVPLSKYFSEDQHQLHQLHIDRNIAKLLQLQKKMEAGRLESASLDDIDHFIVQCDKAAQSLSIKLKDVSDTFSLKEKQLWKVDAVVNGSHSIYLTNLLHNIPIRRTMIAFHKANLQAALSQLVEFLSEIQPTFCSAALAQKLQSIGSVLEEEIEYERQKIVNLQVDIEALGWKVEKLTAKKLSQEVDAIYERLQREGGKVTDLEEQTIEAYFSYKVLGPLRSLEYQVEFAQAKLQLYQKGLRFLKEIKARENIMEGSDKLQDALLLEKLKSVQICYKLRKQTEGHYSHEIVKTEKLISEFELFKRGSPEETERYLAVMKEFKEAGAIKLRTEKLSWETRNAITLAQQLRKAIISRCKDIDSSPVFECEEFFPRHAHSTVLLDHITEKIVAWEGERNERNSKLNEAYRSLKTERLRFWEAHVYSHGRISTNFNKIQYQYLSGHPLTDLGREKLNQALAEVLEVLNGTEPKICLSEPHMLDNVRNVKLILEDDAQYVRQKVEELETHIEATEDETKLTARKAQETVDNVFSRLWKEMQEPSREEAENIEKVQVVKDLLVLMEKLKKEVIRFAHSKLLFYNKAARLITDLNPGACLLNEHMKKHLEYSFDTKLQNLQRYWYQRKGARDKYEADYINHRCQTKQVLVEFNSLNKGSHEANKRLSELERNAKNAEEVFNALEKQNCKETIDFSIKLKAIIASALATSTSSTNPPHFVEEQHETVSTLSIHETRLRHCTVICCWLKNFDFANTEKDCSKTSCQSYCNGRIIRSGFIQFH